MNPKFIVIAVITVVTIMAIKSEMILSTLMGIGAIYISISTTVLLSRLVITIKEFSPKIARGFILCQTILATAFIAFAVRALFESPIDKLDKFLFIGMIVFGLVTFFYLLFPGGIIDQLNRD